MNPELSYTPPTEKVTPEPAPQSFLNRLIGVYFSPTETFQEIGRAPRLLMPIIVLALLSLVGTFIFFERIPFERMSEQRMTEAIDSGKITPEQAEQQREGIKKIAPFMKFGAPVLGAISMIIIALIIAGVAKLVSMMMGIDNQFKPLFAVTLYTMLAVSIIATILFVILLYIKPVEEFDLTNPVGSNLAALLSVLGVTGMPKFLKALLTYVDLFYIWKVILLALGFAAVSRKLKTSTALVVTSIVAFVFALCGAAWTSLFS